MTEPYRDLLPPLRPGPVIGLVLQLIVLTLLARTVGIGGTGWVIGLGYAAVVCVVLTRAMHSAGVTGFGPADWVTHTRAVLVGGVTALIAASFLRDVPIGLLVTLTVVALALDAVDGQVARRTGSASTLGARFDMEVDAFLLLALSVYATRVLGWWVLAIGGMRYAYVAAGWLLPRLRTPVPPRYWRKVVAAVQGIALTVVAAEILTTWLAAAVAAIALGLLVESFGRDVVWQWRPRGTEAPARSEVSTHRLSEVSDVTGLRT